MNNVKLFSELLTSEDEINAICKCMMDHGYKVGIKTQYVDVAGVTSGSKKKMKKFYPIIDINLSRDESKSEDIRSIGFDLDLDILKDIQIVCDYFKKFNSEEVEVFLSMKSINDISIRISLELEENRPSIDFDILSNYLNKLDINDEFYKIVSNSIVDNVVSIVIQDKGDKWLDRGSYKNLINRITNSENKDDKEYLIGVYEKFVGNFYSECLLQNKKLILDYDTYSIHRWDKTIMDIKYTIDLKEVKDVTITDSGNIEHRINVDLFKDKKDKISINSMNITISYYGC